MCRVLEHAFEGIGARILAEFSEQTDVAADERLEGCADGSEDRSRTNDDAANQPEIALDLLSGQLKRRADHVMRNRTVCGPRAFRFRLSQRPPAPHAVFRRFFI